MGKLPELLSLIDYQDTEYQVTDIELVDAPHNIGEDEYLLTLLSRHNQVTRIMDWELSKYRAKKGTK